MRFPALTSLRPKRLAAMLLLGAATIATAVYAGNGPASEAATKYTAFAGGGRAGIAVEAFLPSTIFVTVGDTVEWVNPYEEIHTVTFLAGEETPPLIIPATPPPPPGVAPPPGPPTLAFNPKVAAPTTFTDFDGTRYANSGIIGKGQTFALTFTAQGQFPFLCVIHPGMVGTVHVLPAGSQVPTQAQRDAEAQAQLNALLAAGEQSAASTSGSKATNPDGTTTWTVVNAPSAGLADVMRFIPARLEIAAGDTVVWNNNTPVPHTVTFGEFPPLASPQGVINNQVLFPVKTSQAYTGGYANSGFIGTGPESVAGTSFSLTFTQAGTYSYVCVLHADQGMVGVIEVKAASTPGGSVTPPRTGDAGLAAGSGGGVSGWPYSLAGAVLLLLSAAAWAVKVRRSA